MTDHGTRRLMILGAGIYQLPLIRKAKAMGLETLVVSYPGNYPGFAEADRVLYLDTTDTQAVLAAAKAEAIAGIITTGTDVAMKTIGAVCDALGLPGISAASAAMLTDKATMKEAFRRGGVSTSAFRRVSTRDGARSAAEEIGYPLMVKACDVSGSRGITKVDGPEGLERALDDAYAVTHQGHLVIEGFVAGHEIGVDGFVAGGRLALFAPHDKFVYRAGGVTIPAGHAFPLAVDSGLLQRIRTEIERAVAATSYTDGAINADVMLTPQGGASIIEMGGRCGATCIPELISCHTGIDYYGEMIRAALGEAPDLEPREPLVPCMAKLLLSDRPCTVEAIDAEGIAAIQREEGAQVVIDVGPGDAIEAARNGTDRFGSVLVPTASEAELDRVVARVRSCLGTVCR